VLSNCLVQQEQRVAKTATQGNEKNGEQNAHSAPNYTDKDQPASVHISEELRALLMDHCADTGAEVPAWLQEQVDAEEEAPLARCDETTVEYEAIAGSKVRATWMFENVGEAAWPEELYFRQIRGDGEGYEQKITGVAIEAGAQITISVDVDVPAHPGHHALLFRLAYGEDKAEFGDEVFLNLVSAAEDTTP